MPPEKCSKIIKNHGLFTKPEDINCKNIKAQNVRKPKKQLTKDNTETYVHLIKQIMEEAPNFNIDDTIIEMEEHFDLNEFNPY